MSMAEYFPWVFRLLVLALIGWTIFLILRKLLRWIGIVPYAPFGSRQEYLAAALEMDIDLFLERAYVTPRDVIRKQAPPPPENPSAFFDLMGQVERSLKQMDLGSNGVGGGAGSNGPNDVAGVADGIGCYIPWWLNCFYPGWSNARFKPGQWVRIKRDVLTPGNTLGRVIHGDGGDVVSCYVFGGVVSYLASEVEPAYPRKGEWWRWTGFKTARGGTTLNMFPFVWKACDDSYYAPDVEQGLLEPVNFGKG